LIFVNQNMKKVKTLLILTFLLVFITSCQNSEKSNLALFSNQIPEDTPLVFGPDIISTDDAMDFAITFNPEMTELFFTRRKPEEQNKVYAMKLIDGKWTAPEVAFFSASKGWDFEPHINPKGNRLYFGSTRPLNDTIEPSGLYQWYSERLNDTWTEPQVINASFSNEKMMMYLTSSKDETIYFTIIGDGINSGLFYSELTDTKYDLLNRLPENINQIDSINVAHPFIAPDESYIIYDFEKNDGFGDCDLYISFKENGVWTESYNLGPKINTEQCEMTASVSPDGKYLFFHRGGEDIGNIYWVDFIQVKKELLENINSN